jgi:ATP-dependent exoDNAse (exonuclease V) beta subunit
MPVAHDQAARLEALDITQSVIVQAPAGSGKTTLLIQRFLRLLTTVQAPEEILAMTFTKKAANEMRSRIIAALKEAHTDSSPDMARVLQQDQQYGWNLAQNPNRLRIQTIDAFCSFLTHQLPILASCHTQFTITERPTAHYEQAVQAILSDLDHDSPEALALTRLLSHVDNDIDKLHDLIVSLLAKRDQWLPYLYLEADSEQSRVILEASLQQVIVDHLEQLTTLLPASYDEELVTLLHFAANQTFCEIPEALSACQSIKAKPGTQLNDYLHWLGIANLLLTQSGSWRKKIDSSIGFPSKSTIKDPQLRQIVEDYKNRAKQLIEVLETHETLRIGLHQLRHLPRMHYTEEQWSILKDLIQILKITTAQLKLHFHQAREIDYTENALAALTALGSDESPTDLALTLDYQIKHILVDEFQDTSHLQFKLLELLTRGWENGDDRTLFLVGDPMQSIYRFRNAEVLLFTRAMSEGIRQITLKSIVLSANFRSSPELVHWNNALFQNILAYTSNTSLGAVIHAPSHPMRAEEGSMPAIAAFDDEEGLSEAKYIVDLIKQHQSKAPDERIAILVRSRKHLAAIIPALKAAHIAYQGTQLDLIAEKQAVLDVITLTQALLQPEHRLAWLAVLRAPWCGLTLSDLYWVAHAYPNEPLCQVMHYNEHLHQMSEDGKARLNRVLHILNEKIANRGRASLRVWVTSAWEALGGPACLHSQYEMDDVQAYFELLDTLDTYPAIFSMNHLEEALTQFYATTKTDDRAVQIMTIHSAKGLEFDTVIIPRLEASTKQEPHPLLLWMEQPLRHHGEALLLAPIKGTHEEEDPIYRYILESIQQKQNFELDRLLYVATTRAKKHLYLSFNGAYHEDNLPPKNSFLKRAWTGIQSFITYPQIETENASPVVTNKRYLARLSAAWQHPLTYEEPKVALHQGPLGHLLYKKPNREVIGTVMHRILEALSLYGKTWWEKQNHPQKMKWIPAELQSNAIPLSDLASCSETVMQMAETVLKDEKAQWILHPHAQAQSELKMTRSTPEGIAHYIIDRTFIDETGTRWIIDYKTSHPEDMPLPQFIEQEEERYREKMLLYKSIFESYDNHPIRLGLYFPAIPLFREIQEVLSPLSSDAATSW